MNWPNISELVDKFNKGEVTAEENVLKSLDLIDKGNKYNSIISINRDEAIKRARQIDEDKKNGKTIGKLAGVPYIAKDNFLTKNLKTTAASNMLKDYQANYQSTATKLLEDQGAIMVAKSNLDAFAHGTSTENSDFFTTSNPMDMEYVAGGSSGGSAAAVALDMAPFALGTDTGGSIRLPASFCGIVGYKPTYGSVSRSGVVAMASSLDAIGVLTKNVADAALVQEIITEQDALDSTTIELEDRNFSKIDDQNKKYKFGLLKEHIESEMDSNIKSGILNLIEKLKSDGHQIEEVSIPELPLTLAVYYIVCPAEVASNLSRYDGIRYGHSSENSSDLEEYYLNSRSEGFGAEAKRRIMIGTHVLSSGYFDAYYNKAQTVRTQLINSFNNAFNKYDFLIGPTSPSTAFKIGEKSKDPLSMYLMDIMTVATNLVGVPAISIPAGMSNGLPYGVQIMSNLREDHKLFNVSRIIEGLNE